MLDWIISILQQYGILGLIIMSFLDSFISPIPPEVLLIPLSLINPRNALFLSIITTITSVLGALVGYWIGIKGGRPILHRLFSKEKIYAAEKFIHSYSTMAVFIGAFTPIPYKIITVSSGVFKLPLQKMIFWSTLGRGARFGLEAVLIMAYGEDVVDFLTGHNFSLLTVAITVIILVLYFLYVMRKKNRKTYN